MMTDQFLQLPVKCNFWPVEFHNTAERNYKENAYITSGATNS